MEIEYEQEAQSSLLAPSGPRDILNSEEPEDQEEEEEEQEDEQDDAEGGVGGDGEEEEEEVEAAEDGQDEAETSAPKTKAKRVMKQRQSLADKQLGTTLFPTARIKRIMKMDKDVDMLSQEATFMIAVATEYFIKHFMEEGYTKARLDKRRIINYRDMAAVAQRSEEFDFLKDVVPMPIPLSEALERRREKQTQDENPSLHEDTNQDTSEVLPPLVGSTNPSFPNAMMKKPTNTHPKGPAYYAHKAAAAGSRNSMGGDEGSVENEEGTMNGSSVKGKGKEKEKEKSREREKDKEREKPATPKPYTGKNAPSTPRSLTTRGVARRSLVGSERPDITLPEPHDTPSADPAPLDPVVNERGEPQGVSVVDDDERMDTI